MSSSIPYYWQSMDWEQFMLDYPPPPSYAETVGRMSDDEMRSLQERRFLQRVAEAWDVPFYRDLWARHGIERGDITGLDDLITIPTFTSEDLKDSIAASPPYGLHHPPFHGDAGRLPLKIHTSGGTTGMPRVTLFDPVALEVQAVQAARAFYAQGARPGHLMQIPMTTSLANAPWMAYWAAFHWLGCIPITSGSGVVTPSERQVEFARAWGTNIWYAFPEYLARLSEVADDMGFDVRELPTQFLHSYLGGDVEGKQRQRLEETWGAPVYDNYGTHEIGLIGFECERQGLMHVFDDTVVLQVQHVDDGTLLPYGQEGDLVATSLHRSMPPIIRYNVRDKMQVFARDDCPCGIRSHRMSTFMGRSDEMVKLRGTNVYPRACENAIHADDRTSGEFLCVATREGSGMHAKDVLIIRVERMSDQVDSDPLRRDLEAALKRDLGVRVPVEVVEKGTLAEYTGVGFEGKPRRLLDLRGQE